MNVGIVGLGYVGLPLALQFVSKNINVIGFDVDETKIRALNGGNSYIRYILPATINAANLSGNFQATSDFSKAIQCDAIIICVPTPLTKHREPDIKYILSAGRSIADYIQPNTVVILESTTYPGTTDEDLRPVLEAGSKLKAGVDFHLAFSPEREDPGNGKFNTGNIPKVVGGLTPACAVAAKTIYEVGGINTVGVSSNRAAEATKLLENIFRCVNIALVNELKIVFDKMDIDIWEVVNAAKTKPFGYMPFYPGPGLGGHCIPIDPFYLTWKAREFGVPTKFIELAGETNTEMPHYVVEKLIDGLSSQGKAIKDAFILLSGVAYKKDVDDMRESPSFVIWEMLQKRGARVHYYDPYIPVIPAMHEHPQFAGEQSIELNPIALKTQDAILILTDHSNVDYNLIAEHSQLMVDTRNACKDIPAQFKNKLIKA